MKKYLIYLLFFLSILGCEKEGPEGKKSLIDFVLEPIGENCPNGGYKVVTGLDLNSNNVLDENEIDNTKYICNGLNGSNSLLNIIAESAGEHCPAGGYKVIAGVDYNSNGILDENEIQNSEYICNGINGVGDIETRIGLEWWSGTFSSTPVKGIGIYGFNKDNFPGVDSIIFVGTPYSDDVSSNSIVDLYDFTANQVIVGSEIKSNKNSDSAGTIFSVNIYDSILSGNRDLGMRIRSEIEGKYSGTNGKCYLYLYRN